MPTSSVPESHLGPIAHQIELVGYSSKFLNRATVETAEALSIQLPRESSKLSAGFVAENANVILGNAALGSVTLTAKNAWAGEGVPNRVIADQPVSVAQMLLRHAADALAAHFDTVFVEGTTSSATIDVTSGLLDVTTNRTVTHDDDPADYNVALAKMVDELAQLPEQVRLNATWGIGPTYAANLSKLAGPFGNQIYGNLIASTVDSRPLGLPAVTHSSALGAQRLARLEEPSRLRER